MPGHWEGGLVMGGTGKGAVLTLVERSSRFVLLAPLPGEQPPVLGWKRDEWFEGTLPLDDPALDDTAPTAPSIPRF